VDLCVPFVSSKLIENEVHLLGTMIMVPVDKNVIASLLCSQLVQQFKDHILASTK
jgi:hypothetical protein